MALKINLDCPNCKKKFEFDFGKAGKGKTISCPHCKSNLRFNDNQFKELDDSYKKLLKTFDRFGKK